ncbi:MAG: SMC-Scp complex subunit ScpB, partial [Parvularculaceae bacterium]|nr:SMC-Scp complex subunit ScpB [Parvularculaceae bacterium]
MTDDGRSALQLEGLDPRAAQEALADAFTPPDREMEMDDESDAAPDAPMTDPAEAALEALQNVRRIEALLFASPDALSEEEIAARLPACADIAGALEALQSHYANRGVHLVRTAGRWRFQTAADVAPVLETQKVEPRRLSRAALETLAIIAYHQPCTRADIEDVRGVAVSKGSLDQLLEIGWVRLKGRRRDAPGRPVLYATTPAFLEHFTLETVSDLPGLADLKAAGLLEARLP